MDRPNETQKDRIRAVIAQLEARPDTFEMAHWIANKRGETISLQSTSWCDTVACIAGHAAVQAGYVTQDVNGRVDAVDPLTGVYLGWEEAGIRLLGLPRWVFFFDEWPREFRDQCPTPVRDPDVESPEWGEGEAPVACALLRRMLDDNDPLWEREEEEEEVDEPDDLEEEEEGDEADP